MTPARWARIQAALARRQPDLTLLMDRVHKRHNLAAVVRTCDAVGVHELHAASIASGWHPARGTSLGAERWVRVHPHPDARTAAHALRRAGFLLYAAHFSEQAVDFREADYTFPCAIMLGAEKQGLSDEAAEMADRHLIIPMMGMGASLNVSVAAGIFLAEAQRQRLEAGLYRGPRLSPEEYRQALFRWAHPIVAHYCDTKAIPYPRLDGRGNLESPQNWQEVIQQGDGAQSQPPSD